MGGKEGIKTLYHDFFSEKSEFGYRFEIIPFNEFLNGKNIVFKALEETDKTKNLTYSSEVSKEYSINSFFENEFIFKDLSNLKISFTFTIKEKIIKDINKQIEVLTVKDSTLLITEVLLHFEEQIKHCKNISTSENKTLLSKVKYFKENYIELYNTLHKLYNPYLINYERLSFEKIQTKENKDEETLWFQVGILFAEGKIQDLKKKNPKLSFADIAKYFNNSSYDTYIKATVQNYTKSNTDKNLFLHIEKIKKILSYCRTNNINICEDFTSKYNKLIEST